MKTVQVARFRAAPPDAKRSWRVSPCQKSAVRCPTRAVAACLKSLTNSKSLQKLARVVARFRGQPAGKEVVNETSDGKRAITYAEVNTGGFLTTTPPPAHAGRSFEASLLERRTVRTNTARQNHQTALGKFLKFVQKRTHPLVEDVEIDGALVAYPNDCFVQGVQHHNGSKFHRCSDGLLAVIQPL